MVTQLGNIELELMQGDITELDVDAIVNAANAHLVLGAGVAGAILRKGGHEIQEECNAIGGCPVGQAVITSGGKLKARHVIHAVGPKWGEGNEEAKLLSAVRSAILLTDEKGLVSIALPALSAGIFGFPIEHTAKIMLSGIISLIHSNELHSVKKIVLCLYGTDAFLTFSEMFSSLK
jgi:O-acetyl-ADP-ribose deacetylase (regulator of RNase III)